MPRKAPSRRIVIDEEICKSLEERMATMRRKEDISRFIEWVLDLYVSGYLGETAAYRKDLEFASEGGHLQMWLKDHPEARDKDRGLKIEPPKESTPQDDFVRATKIKRVKKAGTGEDEQRKTG